MASQKKSVLFICLGNICRSPMAEAVFEDLIKKKGELDLWRIDSAALGPWHVGGGPDKRTMSTLRAKNITDYKHTVRQLKEKDYTEFDYIFGMDEDNIEEMNERRPKNCTAKLQLLGQYHPSVKGSKGELPLIIRDPYYDSRTDMSGFETVYDQCVDCCEEFLKQHGS